MRWMVLAGLAVLLAGMARADAAADVVTMANRLRAQNGLPALAVSPALAATAQGHAQDMAAGGYFSHSGRDGSSVGRRATRQGYRFCLIAENIAKGQKSAAEVMQTWAASPGHRKNMLMPKLREIGVARAAGDLWVMVLGTRRGGC
ncbi:MAG: CAP domain-containing protein [Paracoccaceae bacterium]